MRRKRKQKINSHSVPKVADREEEYEKDNKLILGWEAIVISSIWLYFCTSRKGLSLELKYFIRIFPAFLAATFAVISSSLNIRYRLYVF